MSGTWISSRLRLGSRVEFFALSAEEEPQSVHSQCCAQWRYADDEDRCNHSPDACTRPAFESFPSSHCGWQHKDSPEHQVKDDCENPARNSNLGLSIVAAGQSHTKKDAQTNQHQQPKGEAENGSHNGEANGDDL